MLRRRLGMMRDGIRSAAHRGAERGRGILVRVTPVDRGQARAAWRTRKFQSELRGPDGTNPLADILNDAPHIGVLEKGARPHKMSPAAIEALAGWVYRKIIGGDKGARAAAKAARPWAKRSSGASNKKGVDDARAEALRIANAIAWKIRKHGQAPKYFVRDARSEVVDALAAEVLAEMNRVASKPTRGSR